MLDLELKLENKNSSIQRWVLEELRDQINKDWGKHVLPLTKFLRNQIESAIKASKEYESLTSKDGRLRTDFGLEDAKVVDEIIDIIVDQTTVAFDRLRVSGQGLAGGFKVSAIELNWKQVLSSPAASYVSVGADGAAVEIPWAKWILTKGNAVLVKNYYVSQSIGLGKQWSRTNSTLMIHKEGSAFQVPAIYSGTNVDNLVTRSIEKERVWDMFESELHRRLFS